MSLSKSNLIAFFGEFQSERYSFFYKSSQAFQDIMKMIAFPKKDQRNRFDLVLGFLKFKMMNDHPMVQMRNSKQVSRIKFKEKEKDGS